MQSKAHKALSHWRHCASKPMYSCNCSILKQWGCVHCFWHLLQGSFDSKMIIPCTNNFFDRNSFLRIVLNNTSIQIIKYYEVDTQTAKIGTIIFAWKRDHTYRCKRMVFVNFFGHFCPPFALHPSLPSHFHPRSLLLNNLELIKYGFLIVIATIWEYLENNCWINFN